MAGDQPGGSVFIQQSAYCSLSNVALKIGSRLRRSKSPSSPIYRTQDVSQRCTGTSNRCLSVKGWKNLQSFLGYCDLAVITSILMRDGYKQEQAKRHTQIHYEGVLQISPMLMHGTIFPTWLVASSFVKIPHLQWDHITLSDVPTRINYTNSNLLQCSALEGLLSEEHTFVVISVDHVQQGLHRSDSMYLEYLSDWQIKHGPACARNEIDKHTQGA